MEAMSNGTISIAVSLTEISVGNFVTVTSIILSEAAYLAVPLNETVMLALPSPTAIIWPKNTVATLEFVVLYFKAPASAGVKVALIVAKSNGTISKVVFSIVISVGIFVTVTSMVLFSAALYLIFPLK